MSAVLDEFISFLGPRVEGQLQGTAKLVIRDEGALMLDQTGARAGDDAADVTLSASEQVFRAILSADQNPATAYMTGKLKVDGSLQRALKVSAILTA
ncbi:SCP2 sterol-binding domain-containing protein [Seohaeicola saemankumensis]|uniref:SCP2 sterol-binding domain-containing protein n=1 Tax=Seohaeicola saemankumensis TaxID=481181 RepID=UPI001E547524|nr:SCP2 sterol-binding domain-containing protein [Seohaeicola saemankumensis]MCD1626228.1 SCP2 sterol-binding domain-containing protein [Seohaeicola saemankumensis]